MARPKSAYVLIVDDDTAIREAIAESLVDEGHTVRVAIDGREGLEICSSPPLPDLILLDLAMPVMDGREFLHRKQQSAALASIPVCVMTAHDRSRPAPANTAAFIRKPFDLDHLIAIVTRLCG